MVIKVGDKWCKATTTWKFWWNFLAKSLFFSRYPSFSPFECPDAYKCYTFSESYGSRETREIKISTSKFDLEAQGILSPLWTQTGPWSDTASYSIIVSLPPAANAAPCDIFIGQPGKLEDRVTRCDQEDTFPVRIFNKHISIPLFWKRWCVSYN